MRVYRNISTYGDAQLVFEAIDAPFGPSNVRGGERQSKLQLAAGAEKVFTKRPDC